MKKNNKHVVIIGGGFGGLTAAKAFEDANAEVTLIDRSNHHLFQPLLYQVATAGLSPADIAAPIRAILRSQANTEVLMAEVDGINVQDRLVLMKDRQVSYDYLVIATGATHSYFGRDEWRRFAPGLKSIVDATTIRRNILLAFENAEMEPDQEKKKAWLTFVMVGAGPTGVEMAGSIAELSHKALKSDFRHIEPAQTRIILVEAGPRILAGFPEDLATKARKKLETFGVEILTGARVEHIDESGVAFSNSKIPARTVIWCAGVAASPAGKWLQAEVDRAGRVKVRPDLSVPGHPEIFVIGDTACCVQDEKPLPGVAPVAMQQGRYAASIIKRKIDGETEVEPFRYRNHGNLATVGRSFAIVDLGRIKTSGFIAWMAWIIVHIYYLIGFRNRILVMVEWGWAYLTFQRGARLITIDEQDKNGDKILKNM
ncbi:MAG: NAD(P)/FAD-dependent oxidoreductase [Nitrospinae bacterium]|nr:NAD(P)/FAD-dependent oxidoreductase [Nitrospinota bacterium]